jgi:SAM-dependent methyltransferase
MMTTLAPAHSWAADLSILQCVDCGNDLEPADEALTCPICSRTYAVRDDILDVHSPYQGNNKAAADWYNSRLWPAFRFWEKFGFLLNGGDGRARRQILRHLPDVSGTCLLEVAIGDGYNVRLLPDDCRIYGVDISTVQLANCRKRYPERGLRLVLGEAETLPFRDHSFDHVLSVGGFNFFNDHVRALREMCRVVRPGGKVVVADEVPYLANILLGRRIGLRGLDRWILSKFMLLGNAFADVVDRHRDLKLQPIVDEVAGDWRIHPIWRGIGYCIAGQPRT